MFWKITERESVQLLPETQTRSAAASDSGEGAGGHLTRAVLACLYVPMSSPDVFAVVPKGETAINPLSHSPYENTKMLRIGMVWAQQGTGQA